MANFTTHIAVGTIVSGAAATLTLAANVISPESLVAVAMAGIVGSILPDIDLKDSRPSRAVFAGLAVFFSFCVLFVVAPRYSIAEMWLVWLVTLGLVRYGAHAMFHRFSYHRGIWHSVLAGLLFWFVTAIIYKHMLGLHEGVAWLAGGFLFVGYLTHLILDEIYSVDLFDRRIKASFGSALKLVDMRHPGDTAIVGVLAVIMFLVAPSSKPFVDGISSPQLWSGLQQRLLPHDKWFGVLDTKRVAAPGSTITGSTTPGGEAGNAAAGGGSKATATTSDMTTGSLQSHPTAGAGTAPVLPHTAKAITGGGAELQAVPAPARGSAQ